MGRYNRVAFKAVGLALAGLLASGCGGGGAAEVGSLSTIPAAAAPSVANEGLPDLNRLLSDELARLGIDIRKTVAATPAGEDNAVFDLAARLVDPAWPNVEYPITVELSWTERLAGDYNQDGRVSSSDLVPIALHWQEAVRYRYPDLTGGFEHWPTGNPDMPAGALNWRRAGIDGSGNGLIDAADITTIAQHWNEQLDGYVVFCRKPDSGNFYKLPNPDDRTSQLTVVRPSAAERESTGGDQAKPIRYRLQLEAEQGGEYEFFVAPLSLETGGSGPAGNLAQLLVSTNAPPVPAVNATPDQGDPPLLVYFNASASYDPDGTIAGYAWDWDSDGEYDFSSGADPTVSHTIAAHGLHAVTVQVTDDRGAMATASVELHLTENQPPTAKSWSYEGASPLLVRFWPSFGWDEDGSIVLVEFDWEGDGVFDASGPADEQITHTYEASGNYQAIVRVTDDDGATAEGLISLSVDPPPVAEIKFVPENVKAMNQTLVIANVEDRYNDIVKLEWDWEGDGVFDFESNEAKQDWPYHQIGTAVHVFESAGMYQPVVRVTNSKGVIGGGTGHLTVGPSEGSPFWHPSFPSGYHEAREVTAALIGGRPALVYLARWDHESHLVFQVAKDGLGEQWAEPVAITSDVLTSAPDGNNLFLIEAGGVPAVTFAKYRHGEDAKVTELLFCRALDPSGEAWGEPVVVASNAGEHSSLYGQMDVWHCLANIDGIPAVCYSYQMDDRLVFRRALDATGEEWGLPRTAAVTPVVPRNPSLASIAGHPAIAFWNCGLCYVRAGDPDGDSWPDYSVPDPLGGEYLSLATVDGLPAVAYYRWGPNSQLGRDLVFIRATDSLGEYWGSPQTLVDSEGTDNIGRFPSLVVVDGFPAIAYSHDWCPGYIRASDPQGVNWQEPQLPPVLDYGDDMFPLLELEGGIPGIGYNWPCAFGAYY